jgi:hypothetical protein
MGVEQAKPLFCSCGAQKYHDKWNRQIKKLAFMVALSRDPGNESSEAKIDAPSKTHSEGAH